MFQCLNGLSGGADPRYAQIKINCVKNLLDFDKYWLWASTKFIVIARFLFPFLHCERAPTKFISCKARLG